MSQLLSFGAAAPSLLIAVSPTNARGVSLEIPTASQESDNSKFLKFEEFFIRMIN